MNPTAITLAVDAQATFNELMGNVSAVVQVIGGGMVAFGLVTLGMNLFGTASGNGGSIGAGLGWMAGGVLIFIAGTILGSMTI